MKNNFDKLDKQFKAYDHLFLINEDINSLAAWFISC